MKIKPLDSHLISQIAAGEVIERPSSIIKELLENCLDAGATSIDVEVERGGSKLIRLRDNGCGIDAEDLPLALCRHATSKIATLADLEKVGSLGFRGEALASISAIARFKLSSRVAAAAMGWQLVAEDGKVGELQPVAHPLGTTVEVSDLFFNVPVRRRFLRKESTEFSHITEVMGRLVLSRFDVAYTFRHNGKVIWNLSPAKSVTESLARVGKVVGQEFIGQANYLESGNSTFQLRGWISSPNYTRNQPDLQYLYINGRVVRDKNIAHAIRHAYRDLVFQQRHPVVVLYLDIDPTMLDVNVHPTKAEVRFSDSRMVHDFISQALRRGLESGRSVHSVKNPSATPPEFSESVIASENTPPAEREENEKGNVTSAVPFSAPNLAIKPPDELPKSSATLWKERWQERLVPSIPRERQCVEKDPVHSGDTPQQLINSLNVKEELAIYQRLNGWAQQQQSSPQLKVDELNENATCHHAVRLGDEDHGQLAEHEGIRSVESTESSSAKGIPPLGYALAQLGSTYILAENSTGLIVVDIHAAHERINYERLKKEYHQARVPMQQLLIPIELALNPREYNCAVNHQDLLRRAGWDLSCLAENHISLCAVPLLLIQSDLAQLIRDVLADLLENENLDSLTERTNHILATMACHSSIRAGQILNQEAMNLLLREVESTVNGDQCGHGRPTWVSLDLAALAKLFLRSG